MLLEIALKFPILKGNRCMAAKHLNKIIHTGASIFPPKILRKDTLLQPG